MNEDQAKDLLEELKVLNKMYKEDLARQADEREKFQLQEKEDLEQKEKEEILNSEKNQEAEKLEQEFRSDVLIGLEELNSNVEKNVKENSINSLIDQFTRIDKVSEKLDELIEVSSTKDVQQETISNVSDLSVILVVWVILPVAIIYKLFVAWWERYF